MPFFDVFKKNSKNEQNIKDHCMSLVSCYIEYAKMGSTAHFDPENIFRNFPDNQSFLSHLGTGHESTYSLLENYVLLNREINTQIMPEPIWKEKTKQASSINLEFKHEFEKLLLKVEHGTEEFGGICEECRKWHSEDDPDSKELCSKLKAFKMPF
ncbi:MAG: hypothetical protein ACREAN_05325 [Nitrosopumilaceae archaeon]